ncbi:hypothetical protein ABKN59_011032 [Abortiporus biennis]
MNNTSVIKYTLRSPLQ